MILQMKLGRLDRGYFLGKFGVDIVEVHAEAFARLEAEGMLHVDPDGVTLTRTGLLRADHLLPDFYAEEFRGVRYT
jgi:oxygen-independent coproporphyrinogen III oxidase